MLDVSIPSFCVGVSDTVRTEYQVAGLGFRVWGMGFRFQGLGFQGLTWNPRVTLYRAQSPANVTYIDPMLGKLLGP